MAKVLRAPGRQSPCSQKLFIDDGTGSVGVYGHSPAGQRSLTPAWCSTVLEQAAAPKRANAAGLQRRAGCWRQQLGASKCPEGSALQHRAGAEATAGRCAAMRHGTAKGAWYIFDAGSSRSACQCAMTQLKVSLQCACRRLCSESSSCEPVREWPSSASE